MHRSRLPVLVIFAAAAACSTHDSSEGTEILSQDRTLVAGLQTDHGPLPAACGTVATPAQPAASSQAQAKDLSVKAQSAEMQGHIADARSLLHRSLDLDGTSKSVAYHLGRTSEALGDHAGAIAAYCRYLALAPTTTESAEARQRVATLSQGTSGAPSATTGTVSAVASGSVAPTTTGGVTQRVPASRHVSVASARRVTRVVRQPNVVESQRSTTAHAEESAAAPAQPGTVATSTVTTKTDQTSTDQTSTVASDAPASTVDQPSTAPRAERRGPSRTQAAIVGAATGAIIGAATGRSVKGAVIGAAAGGILGTAVGGRTRPAGRAIRS